MKAALKTADGTFDVTEAERPIIPAPHFVLARVRVAGICGTDLRHWKKHEPELECHIMGHELAGEVVEVGEAVTNVKPGDRVVIETVMGDGFANIAGYSAIISASICMMSGPDTSRAPMPNMSRGRPTNSTSFPTMSASRKRR